jgi:8-oxo-dGTP pyrophosphatase MutT (NUDIX family)
MSNSLDKALETLEQKLLRGDPLDGPSLVPKPHAADRSITGYRNAPGGRPAAVLIPILVGAPGLNIFFTQRPETMKEHPGQIAFPGGSKDERDKTLTDTALREAWEEIGLEPSLVSIIGSLTPYQTITGYRVTPVIGLIQQTFAPTLDAREVADTFEAPLGFFLDKANIQKHTSVYQGKLRPYYAFDYEGRFIWGATADMLINLREVLLAYAGVKE